METINRQTKCPTCNSTEDSVVGTRRSCAGCGAFVGHCELWRDVPGYHGKYRVSNLGLVCTTRGGFKMLKPSGHRDGYGKLNLSYAGRQRTWHVHALVAWTWLGPKPVGCVVDHKNRNHDDNRVENLRYITFAESNANRSPPGTSPRHAGQPCVYRDATGGFYARTKWGGKHKRLGRFETIEAAVAEVEKRRKLVG